MGEDNLHYGHRAFVKVPRKSFQGEFWLDERVFSRYEAWLDIIQQARYSENSTQKILGGRMITWNRGQLPVSIRYLSKRWKWGQRKIQNFLDYLIVLNFISSDISQGQTIITVLDTEAESYLLQQPLQQQLQQPLQQQLQQTNSNSGDCDKTEYSNHYRESYSNSRADHHKTVRKKKESSKKVNIGYAFDDPEFITVYDEYADYRKRIKKPITPRGNAKDIALLQKYELKTAIAIVVQSLDEGWKGIFPLKTNNNANQKTGTSEARTSMLAAW